MSDTSTPNGWDIQRLDKIASVERGKFSARPRNDPKYYGGYIPFLQTGDVSSSNGTVTSYRQTLNEEGLGVSRLFDKGTLLITIAANIGDVAEVAFDFACPDSLVAVVPKNNISKAWLKYFLITQKQYFQSRATQNAQANINLETIRPIKVVIPPIPEQRAISDLLSSWDEAIEKTERLIQAKGKRFKWLLRELILEPRKRQNDVKWKKVKIGSFLTESRITGANGRDAQKITVKLYGKGVIPKDEKRIGSATTQYYVRKSGQFIYSKLDFLNGAFGIIPDELDGFESTLDLPAFDITDSVSKEWFLYYLIRPEYYKRQLGLAKGQRKARRVNPSEFLNSKIPVPPLDEQQQISKTLSFAQHEIDLMKQLAEKYKIQKRGLMQKMLTGEWRVKPEILKQYE